MSIAHSSSENAQGFVSSSGYNWTFGSADSAFEAYSAQALPTNVFIDRSGNVVNTIKGSIDAATLEAELKKIL